MEKKPLVSVCVITYGHEHFIEQSINSILNQECDFPIEVIVSNDCSPDNTNNVIENILKNHPKAKQIRYFNHKINIGAISNFFFSLSECEGKYVAICEGDDYWIDEKKVQKQIDFLEKNPDYSLCFSSRNTIDNDINLISTDNFEFKDWNTNDILNGIIPPMQTIISKNLSKEFITFYQKHKGSFGADKIYSYFYSLHGKLKSIPDITAVYRSNGLGIWSKLDYFEKQFLHIDESLKFYKIIANDEKEFNVLKQQLFLRIIKDIHFSFISKPVQATQIYFKILAKYKPPLKSVIFARIFFLKYYLTIIKNKTKNF
ncbi:glycosyltransferase family 2 protein [Flavobacterium sp.]|uniref:glycosyltransferase family 2 protein n=1 Tax=Flavobacterium sp. TaxID=239 RepID=UPI0037531B0F